MILSLEIYKPLSKHLDNIYKMSSDTFFIPNENIDFRYEDIPNILSVKLLEVDWKLYKFLLEKYAEYRKPEDVLKCPPDLADPITAKINNNAEIDGWYSSHLQCLSYLAGDLTHEAKVKAKKYNSDHHWYGMNVSIPDKEATEILHLMLSFGANVNIPNCYEETVFDTLDQKDTLACRENNKLFRKCLENHVISNFSHH